jgi:hypothetical protein
VRTSAIAALLRLAAWASLLPPAPDRLQPDDVQEITSAGRGPSLPGRQPRGGRDPESVQTLLGRAKTAIWASVYDMITG